MVKNRGLKLEPWNFDLLRMQKYKTYKIMKDNLVVFKVSG